MDTHTDFFKKTLILLGLSFMISCGSDKQVNTVEEYYHSSYKQTEDNDITKNESIILSNDKKDTIISYVVKLKRENMEDKVIESNFIYRQLKYRTPLYFKNTNNYNFKYSLMPEYSEKTLVGKKINLKNISVILIRGENPFCNGNYCQSYYLHLLILNEGGLESNLVYEFNSIKEIFEDFNVSLEKNVLLLINNKTVVGKIEIHK